MKQALFVILLSVLSFSLNVYAAVNLNTATQQQLEEVKGIGPSKAKAIVEYRNKNGQFKSVDDLDKVKGFGKKSIDKLRSEVSVSAAAPAAPASSKK
jgi:competence protein ComEA